jgi:hypothetical protein
MSFEVDTQALRRCRGRLQDLASDTSSATSYVQEHVDLTGEDGRLFAHVDNVCRDVRARLDDVIGRLRTIFRDSGAELGSAATYYDDTDRAAAEQADGTIEALPGIPAGEGYDADAPFEDTVPEDPGEYTPRPDPDEPDDGEMIMAPGPLGQPPASPTGPVA